METAQERNIAALNHLITIATDGQHGYSTAAEHAKDPVLKASFIRYAAERAEFAHDLRTLVNKTGYEADQGGGPVGALHRAWIDIKTAVTSNDNKAVLQECITGDQAAVNAYQTELNDNWLTDEQRLVLERHLKLIKDALFYVEGEHRKLN
ncbi:ferritin-like domain-containing protein [Mucilaginibacter sp. KACC 22063]|uniref:ferritin-like domain-containing protein n=1 Tax=Mucilaginibacter sp. KACC 22063 TaxID=3025666 RepID=UPI00236706C2|nr:PA2169 family four-helix-bundle protein [Mucilaginibacter sp. KACC 22063]WDF56916.1 PA2169 family four-helix-bundle protein [Mucilaginibacter sp. KACC 22063]